MLETYEQHSKRKLIATFLTVIVIAGIVVLADHLKSKPTITTASTATQATPPATDTTTNSTDTATTAPATTSTNSNTSGDYKDGTYTASSSYYVPHGNETIQVNVTLSGGSVTAVSIKNSESDNDSASYQEEFASAYKSYVVGKSISGLKLSNIAGASDTTEGFNDAISQIATKAQA